MENAHFEQCLDVSRPHTLTEGNRTTAGQLTYRYDDNMEIVTVPNAWYNQPYPWRVEYIRVLAMQAHNYARQLTTHTQVGMSTADAAALARRYRERAARIRAEAARIEAAGTKTYPVAASSLPLDFGPNAT